MPPPAPNPRDTRSAFTPQSVNNSAIAPVSSTTGTDQPIWNGTFYELDNEGLWASHSSLTPWDPSLHAGQQDNEGDELVEEEDEEDIEYDHDEAMPDIQRSPLFETTTVENDGLNEQGERQSNQQSPFEGVAGSHERPHRQAYSDASAFVYGDSTWSPTAFSPISRHRTSQTPSLRRTAGLSSTIRNRAEIPRFRQPPTIATDDGSRAQPASGFGQSTEQSTSTDSSRMDTRSSEYAGWAPGTATSEHQRSSMNILRSMARGSGTSSASRGMTLTANGVGRSPAMTALERRYWAEQERQHRHRAAEQEAISRRIQVRDSNWANHPDGNTGAGRSMVPPSSRSMTYGRTEGINPTLEDLNELRRDLEEMRQEDENEAAVLNRRARRELQRARRAHPLDEVRRDDLRRGLYDLHRDRHSDAHANSEPARRHIEEAIKYLEKLRACESTEQAYRAAEDGGLIRDGRSDCDLADFIFDSKVVSKTPWTSWLVPGTRFSGFQHAVTTSALPYTIAGSGSIRIRNPSEFPHVSRIPTATASSNPNSSTFRPSWIESVIQRDRHTGASNTSGPLFSGTTVPNSSSGGQQPAVPQTRENEDTWPVKVTITSVDYDKCKLTGTMEAMNVPNKTGSSLNAHNSNVLPGTGPEQTTITTFLEGEIIDLNRHSLETCGFNADSVVDSTYWRRLEPFKSLSEKEIPTKLVSSEWLSSKIGSDFILMRWKEKCFVTPSDAGMGLTISGFYYISLHRETGIIEGQYYDPQSSPFQSLRLQPLRSRQFQTYEFQ